MKSIQFKKVSVCSLTFMLLLSVLLPGQAPSKYAQEYAAVMQNPESSINKRTKLFNTFLQKKQRLEYYNFLLTIDLSTFIYTQYNFTSDKQEVAAITSWQSLLQEAIDFSCTETVYASRQVAGMSLVLPEEFPVLHNYVKTIAQKNKIPCPIIYITHDDNFLNATSHGDKERRSIIMISTGLLSQLSSTALETVVTHEIGHIVNCDNPSRQTMNRFFSPAYPSLPVNIFIGSSLLNTALLINLLLDGYNYENKTARFPHPAKVFLVALAPVFLTLVSLFGDDLYRTYCLTHQENRADDFAKKQGCDAAEGINEVETLAIEQKTEALALYSRLLDQYYQDYISKNDYNVKAAQNIQAMIACFKNSQQGLIKDNGYYLSREQRVERLVSSKF